MTQLQSRWNPHSQLLREAIATAWQMDFNNATNPGLFNQLPQRNYRRTDRGYADSSGTLDQYKHAYREAYCNGYQQAYYSETEQLKLLMSKVRAGQTNKAN